MAVSINNTGQITGRSGRTAFDRQMPGYLENLYRQAADEQKPVIRRSFLFLLLKIAALMLAGSYALYWTAGVYGDLVSKGGYTAQTESVAIRIGRDHLLVPENLIRFGSQRGGGKLERLDMYMHWPSMNGYTDRLAGVFEDLTDQVPIIFVALEPRGNRGEMSGRVNTIYSHFFAGPPVDAGDGLVRRPFRKDTAYFSEDLYYEPSSSYPFAVRCIRVTDKVAAPVCMRDIHVGSDTIATYRFPSVLLPQWREIDQQIRRKVASLIVK